MEHILLLLVTFLHCSNPAIIEGPADTVYRNQHDTSATLMCKVDTSVNATLYWLRFELGLVYSTNGVDNYPNDFSYTADKNTGIYTMSIRNLTRKDAGRYICQYGRATKAATIIVAGKSGCIATNNVEQYFPEFDV